MLDDILNTYRHIDSVIPMLYDILNRYSIEIPMFEDILNRYSIEIPMLDDYSTTTV
jgi:hypothetical protein